MGLDSARYSRACSSLQSALAGGGEEQRAVLEVPSWARNRSPGFEDLPWQVLSSGTCFVYF